MTDHGKHLSLMILHPEGHTDEHQEDGDNVEEDPGLESAAEELIEAIHTKDVPGVIKALHAAFTIYESKPHEENDEEGGYAHGGLARHMDPPSLSHRILHGTR